MKVVYGYKWALLVGLSAWESQRELKYTGVLRMIWVGYERWFDRKEKGVMTNFIEKNCQSLAES